MVISVTNYAAEPTINFGDPPFPMRDSTGPGEVEKGRVAGLPHLRLTHFATSPLLNRQQNANEYRTAK